MHLIGRHTPAPPHRTPVEITDLPQILAVTTSDLRRFDLAQLCARLGALRGRRIRLLPVFGRPPTTGCQPWIVADSTDHADHAEHCDDSGYTDYVLVEQNTTAVHRDLLALHTIAHVLLGHPGRPVDTEQVLAGRMPQLDWRRLRPLLGAAYTAYARDEAAADDLAVQILQRAGRLPRINRQPWPAIPATNPATAGRPA